jgi:hypothetical protein
MKNVEIKNGPIKFQLCGLEAEGGFFRLNTLLHQLQFLGAMLKEIDLMVANKKTTYYRIINLKLSSPAEIWLEAIPLDNKLNITPILRQRLIDELNNVRNKADAAAKAPRSFLETLKGITSSLGKEISCAAIISDSHRIDLDKPFRENLEIFLAPDRQCYGSVEGVLEAINLHNKNEFSIFPTIGPRKILCTFTRDLRKQAIEGIEKMVLVSGIMSYRYKEKYPYKIAVKEPIRVYPPEEELPHLADLRGIAPDATGDLSSEEFVGKIRDEW